MYVSRVRYLMCSILHGKKDFWDFRKKNEWFFKILCDHRKEKWQVWNQIFEKLRTQSYFKNSTPPPSTWHQILKHIWILVTFFEDIYKYIQIYMFYIRLKCEENWKKLMIFRPSHLIHPIQSIRNLGASRIVV